MFEWGFKKYKYIRKTEDKNIRLYQIVKKRGLEVFFESPYVG